MFKKTISMMFIWILFVRICMSILSLTWYVPDETWQSVEVAHNTVFGTGTKQIIIIKCFATICCKNKYLRLVIRVVWRKS